MKKITLDELKEYILSEAKKLYQTELLKEEKSKIEKELDVLKETSFPADGVNLSDPETLKQIRQAMLKKAAGWAIPEPAQVISELDKKAMQAAKKDIQGAGHKFEPLGKSKFEKDLDKTALQKAMSPEENLEEKKYGAVNPWAICTSSVGREDKEKYERCVMGVKEKHKIKTDETSQVFTGTDVTDPNVKMYFFKIKHDKGVDKLKIADYSQENAKAVLAKYMNAPESAIEFVKEEPVSK